jgi:hypothetical protein
MSIRTKLAFAPESAAANHPYSRPLAQKTISLLFSQAGAARANPNLLAFLLAHRLLLSWIELGG